MRDPLYGRLASVRLRQRVLRGLQAGAWILVAASLVLITLGGFSRWTGLDISWSIGLLIGTGAFLLGVVAGLVWPLDWRKAATAVDTHYGFKDRAATALSFIRQGRNSTVHRLQIDDALAHLEHVKPEQVVSIRPSRMTGYAIASFAAAVLVLSLAGPEVVDASLTEPNDVIVTQAERAAEELVDLEEIAKEEQDPQLQELVEYLQAKVEAMKQPGVDAREALATLSEMQSAIQAQQAQYNVGAVDAQLQSVGEALSLAEPLAAAGKALAGAQYDKAASELEKLDEPPKLDRQTAKAVREKLEDAAAKMASAGNGSMSKATEKVAAGIGGDGDSFREGSKRLADAAKKQGRRKQIHDLLQKQCNCLGECKSECEGGNCESSGANGKKPGGKKWGRGASGNEPGEQTAHVGGKQEQRLTGKQSDEGDTEVETIQSPEGRQQAQREYRENYAKYRRMSEAVLESEPIPLGHRQNIRRYFELIRPQGDELQAVDEAADQQK